MTDEDFGQEEFRQEEFRRKVEAHVDQLRQRIPADTDLAQLVRLYRTLRDWRSEIKRAADAEAARIAAAMAKAEGLMMAKLDELGVESARTGFGTAYSTLKIGVRVTDWQDYLEWVRSKDAFHLLKAGASKAEVLGFIDEAGETPPGIEVYQEKTIGVRK